MRGGGPTSKGMMRPTWAFAIFSQLLLASATGAAAPPRAEGLVVLDLRFEDLPPAVADSVRQRVRAALTLKGYRVVDEAFARSRLRELAAPVGCGVGPCLSRVAKVFGVQRALVGGIGAHGTSYDFTLTLLETGGGSVLAQVNRRCDVCNFAEVEEAVSKATLQLHDQSLVFLSTRAVLGVQSTPAGAEVLVDGLSVGAAPIRSLLSPGRHVVEVTAKGLRSLKREVALEAGKTRTLTVNLVEAWANFPEGGSPPVPPRRGVPRWAKWVALGAGVSLAGVGGALWGIDGGTTSADERYVRDTRPAGVALVSIGGAAVIAGALLSILEDR